ncbi:MAG: hypothetical protein IPM98_13325 [Lewinellaceae bacterium]|nr:hypothetical protein [Lewinellaceae bacterium]
MAAPTSFVDDKKRLPFAEKRLGGLGWGQNFPCWQWFASHLFLFYRSSELLCYRTQGVSIFQKLGDIRT